MCSLLTELGITIPAPPIIYCDNDGATYLCSNPVFHSRMKLVALDYHFIRDQVQSGALQVAHVSFVDQPVDALTKSLPRSRHLLLCGKIGLSSRSSILQGHMVANTHMEAVIGKICQRRHIIKKHKTNMAT